MSCCRAGDQRTSCRRAGHHGEGRQAPKGEPQPLTDQHIYALVESRRPSRPTTSIRYGDGIRVHRIAHGARTHRADMGRLTARWPGRELCGDAEPGGRPGSGAPASPAGAGATGRRTAAASAEPSAIAARRWSKRPRRPPLDVDFAGRSTKGERPGSAQALGQSRHRNLPCAWASRRCSHTREMSGRPRPRCPRAARDDALCCDALREAELLPRSRPCRIRGNTAVAASPVRSGQRRSRSEIPISGLSIASVASA